MSYSVAFCGTPEFALPSLEALWGQEEFQVELVISQPDRPRGRGHRLSPSPVKKWAEERGIRVETPGRGELLEENLGVRNLDLAVVVAYGRILPSLFLDLFPMGCFNIHASLLPRWRGAAPIQRALMAGDKRGGVCLQKIVESLDAGDIVGSRDLEIPLSMGAYELYEKLSHLGAQLLKVELKNFLRGSVSSKPQEESQVCYATKIQKEEGRIQWSQGALSVHNKVRALDRGGPFAWTTFQGKALKIHKTALSSENRILSTKPGQVLQILPEGFEVNCGQGPSLKVLKVQPESRASMKAGDFARGFFLNKGDQLV